jgi:hypothetical protein
MRPHGGFGTVGIPRLYVSENLAVLVIHTFPVVLLHILAPESRLEHVKYG